MFSLFKLTQIPPSPHRFCKISSRFCRRQGLIVV